MKKNMAILDRFIRFVLAVVMIFLVVTHDYSLVANAALVTVAGIFVITSLSGVCPLYTLFRIDTRQFKY